MGWVAVGLALLVSFGVDLATRRRVGRSICAIASRACGFWSMGSMLIIINGMRATPEEYCDVYNNPKLPVSKTTATPALLMVQAPLAAMPYRLAQLSWLFAQWPLLLGTGWLWLRACGKSWQRWAVAIFLTGFTYTAAWRLARGARAGLCAAGFSLRVLATATLDAKRGSGFVAGLRRGISGGVASAVSAAGAVSGAASAGATGRRGGGAAAWVWVAAADEFRPGLDRLFFGDADAFGALSE